MGFNPELTARDNVLLNGVMMGLSRREAARRLDAVLEFAELEDFVELKLKNYSSGMMVRLAFAVMVQADADIMLIDEVLAVGDAAFAQKCMDVFHEKRRAGKTIVLVTHDMATVQALCHRAMLIHDGEVRYTGDPEETAMRYYRLNFGGADGHAPDDGRRAVPDVHARLVDAWLEDESGERVDNVEQGTPIRLNVVLEAREELSSPIFAVHVLNADGATVFGVQTTLEGRRRGRFDRVRRAGADHRDGSRTRSCRAATSRTATSTARAPRRGALQTLHLPGFVVFGTDPGLGVVAFKGDVEVVRRATEPRA